MMAATGSAAAAFMLMAAGSFQQVAEQGGGPCSSQAAEGPEWGEEADGPTYDPANAAAALAIYNARKGGGTV